MSNVTDKLESILRVKKTPSLSEKELFQKTQEFVRWIRWIPGIRMVAVSNSLAMYATHEGSDIDLFIITAVNRLWIVRTIVLLTAMFLGVRTKPGDEAGKFCFPFFMTEKNLSLQSIALSESAPENSQKRSNLNETWALEWVVQNSTANDSAEWWIQRTSFSGFSDVYLAYWIQTLKPIFNTHYTYGRFMEVNRSFSENTLHSPISDDDWAWLLRDNRVFLLLTRRHPGLEKLELLLSPLLVLKNRILGYISKSILKRKIPTEATEGIIVNNDMMKFHFPDRRKEIRNRVMGSL